MKILQTSTLLRNDYVLNYNQVRNSDIDKIEYCYVIKTCRDYRNRKKQTNYVLGGN